MRKISEKQKERKKEKSRLRTIMLSVFMDIWQDRPHKSEVSGKWLGREALAVFFHHILPKSTYPQGMLDPENIILLSFEEHQKVEADPTCFEEVNKRREQLKLKYDRPDRSIKEGVLEQE